MGGRYDYLFAKNMGVLFFVVLSLVGGFCSAADTLRESRVVGYRSKVFETGDGITFVCQLVRSEEEICFVQGHQRPRDFGNILPLVGFFDEVTENQIRPVELDDYRVFVKDHDEPTKVDWSHGERGQLYKSDVYFMVPKALKTGQIVEGSQDLYVSVSLFRDEFGYPPKSGDGSQRTFTVFLEIPTYRLAQSGVGFVKAASIQLIIPKVQIDAKGMLRFVGKDPDPDDGFVFRGEANQPTRATATAISPVAAQPAPAVVTAAIEQKNGRRRSRRRS